MAHGDVVNTAARIQTAAPVDGILVDERTYRERGFRSTIGQGRRFAPRARRSSVPSGRWSHPRLDGADIRPPRPLVGGQRELDTPGILDEAIPQREPRLATLVGPPGIGKSRLIWELSQRVERGVEMIFGARAAALRQRRHLLGAGRDRQGARRDPGNRLGRDRRGKLRLAVEGVVPDANDARWIEAQLAPAGLTGSRAARRPPRRGVRRVAAVLGGDRGPKAARAGLRGSPLGRRRPPGVRDHACQRALLRAAPRRGDRPSGAPRANRRLASRTSGSTLLELDPLTDDETTRLVSDLLDAPALPSELCPRCWAGRAEPAVRRGVRAHARRPGSPAHGRRERGARRGGAPASGVGAGDRRGSARRPVAGREAALQAASVVGRAFWLGGLATIEEEPRWSVEQRLHELERKHLVRRERDSIVLSEPQFSFSHAVVRDVAYEQIPRPQRAAGTAARRGGSRPSPERSEDSSEMLAHHYLSALKYVPEQERERDDLVDRRAPPFARRATARSR